MHFNYLVLKLNEINGKNEELNMRHLIRCLIVS